LTIEFRATKNAIPLNSFGVFGPGGRRYSRVSVVMGAHGTHEYRTMQAKRSDRTAGKH